MSTSARQAPALPQPTPGCEYPVVIGCSLTGQHGGEGCRCAQDSEYAAFQYKFQPASIDTRHAGLVTVDASQGVTVLRGTTTATAADSTGTTFQGKVVEQKDTECVLLFDGESFRLERCPLAFTQLRPVRNAASLHHQSTRMTAAAATASIQGEAASATMGTATGTPTGAAASAKSHAPPHAAKKGRGNHTAS